MTDATPDGIGPTPTPADSRTPDQIAHDSAVPETPTPLDDAAPDAPVEAVFAADTSGRDAAPDASVDATPDEAVVPVSDTPVMDSVTADQGAPEDYTVPDAPVDVPESTSVDVDVTALVQDTNDRIRNIESVVTGFVDDAKPLLDKMGSGGISGLLGVILGR